MPTTQKCPKCGGLLQDAGPESVRCVECGGKYRLGQKRTLPTSEPFPGIQTGQAWADSPDPPPPVEPNPTAGDGIGISVDRRRRAEPKQSFFGNLLLVFDWKFEHYLTPWIVRINWVLVLAMWALFLVMLILGQVPNGFAYLVDAIPKPGWDVELPNNSIANKAFDRVVGMVAAVFLMFWSLLWTRVFLELVIVVFNIAGSLKRLERK